MKPVSKWQRSFTLAVAWWCLGVGITNVVLGRLGWAIVMFGLAYLNFWIVEKLAP